MASLPLHARHNWIALYVAALLFHAAIAATAAGEDLPQIRARGTLRVLAVPITEGPEFVARRGDRTTGFDVELLDGFCRLEGLKLTIVPAAAWDALVPALLARKGDLIAGGFTDTPSRRQSIAFTVEAFPTRNVVMTRRPHRVVRTVEQLREELVGTIRGTSLQDAVLTAGVPRARIDDTVPPGGLAAALRAGRVTATVDGVETALLAARADKEIQLGMFLGPPESLAYGVRKDSPKLLAALNLYLSNVRRTATWNRLVVKYFGESALDVLKSARSQ